MSATDKKQFWESVDEAYDADGGVLDCVNIPGVDHGDTLAEFIVRELSGCAIGDPIDLPEATRRMERAANQIASVASALIRMAEDAD